MALDEFGLIRRYFQRVPSAGTDTGAGVPVRLGIGDDAALLDLPPGESLAVTTDTLVAGRHFPLTAAAFDIGWKALAVNLSDLAAMGARPQGVTLALTLPEADPDWLAGLSAGFFALADAEGVPLIGGDTTRGPLSLTVTALGSVPPALALRRDGARPGDLVCVSGTLGDAGLGLALALDAVPAGVANAVTGLSAAARDHALARLHRPSPRLALGLALRGIATAAMDVSDGLLQDLGHLLAASAGTGGPLGARLQLEHLPLSSALTALAGSGDAGREQMLAWALAAGDDYELLFTLPPAAEKRLSALADALALPLACIGRVTEAPGLDLRWRGQVLDVALPGGYRHFS